MSCYISKSKPIFKDWQFQSVSGGISKDAWQEVVAKMENLIEAEDDNLHKLFSIQNADFHIYLRHNPDKGNAISLSHFPERFRGEFVKYIKQICEYLDANFYSLNNDGFQEAFDFSRYKEEIAKAYVPLNEKKVTDIEVDEMMGLITIPTTNVNEVVTLLRLKEYGQKSWEEAVEKCYEPNSYMVRSINGWTIVIGQLENLTHKFITELKGIESEKEKFLELLVWLSKSCERIAYRFNASKYGYFENFIAENGKMVYKSIYGDGDQEVEGEVTQKYFDDYLALCYDESILDGVKVYM